MLREILYLPLNRPSLTLFSFQVQVPVVHGQGGPRQEGHLRRAHHQDDPGPHRLRLRGPHCPRAGRHRHGKTGGVPHLGRILRRRKDSSLRLQSTTKQRKHQIVQVS